MVSYHFGGPEAASEWQNKAAKNNTAQLGDVLAAIKTSLSDPKNRPPGFTDEQWDGLQKYVGKAFQAGLDTLNKRQQGR